MKIRFELIIVDFTVRIMSFRLLLLLFTRRQTQCVIQENEFIWIHNSSNNDDNQNKWEFFLLCLTMQHSKIVYVTMLSYFHFTFCLLKWRVCDHNSNRIYVFYSPLPFDLFQCKFFRWISLSLFQLMSNVVIVVAIVVCWHFFKTVVN